MVTRPSLFRAFPDKLLLRRPTTRTFINDETFLEPRPACSRAFSIFLHKFFCLISFKKTKKTERKKELTIIKKEGLKEIGLDICGRIVEVLRSQNLHCHCYFLKLGKCTRQLLWQLQQRKAVTSLIIYITNSN